ncbi:MAG TPA: hypothetical protein VN626_08700 [Clostridia bacterium]|nr:hypothetical protein [Clostridia bacterium]
MRDRLLRLAQPYADEIHIDTLGNLICHRRGSGPKVVIDAQMDSIGFIVSGIDQAGRIAFVPVGSHKTAALVGEKVRLENGALADIRLRPGQAEVLAEKRSCHDMFLSIDWTSGSDAQALPDVGSPVVFARHTVLRADGLVQSPHLSGICGSMVALLSMQQLSACKNDLYFVFSTQAEVGFRGIRSALYNLEPYVYIRLSAAEAGDTPLHKLHPALGPAVGHKCEYAVWDAEVVDALWRGAQKSGVACQYKVVETGEVLPNEVCVQLSRNGVAAGELSIPVSEFHTAREVCCLEDVAQAAKVICQTLENGFYAIADKKIK